MKKALITGITGQDGSYLAEFLLHKGYEVHGIVRRASTFNRERIDHLYCDPHLPRTRLILHYGNLCDSGQLTDIIYNIKPDEIYHLAAQSHVRVSFDLPEYTGDVAALGTTRILETVRRRGIQTKFYQASSSEMFGAAGRIAPHHMKASKDRGNRLVTALDKSDSVGILDSYFRESDFFTEFERFGRHVEKLRRMNS